MTKETITLFYQDAGSDKFYTASIEEVGEGQFLVPFTFGRRGTSGQSGDKLKGVPTSYEKAKKAYDQIVGEKIAKGYKPSPGLSPAEGVAAVAEAKPAMRLLSPEEAQVILDYDRSEMKDLIDEGYVAIEATVGELAKTGVGTCCGTVGNVCFVEIAKKFPGRLVRGFYSAQGKCICGMPLIQCNEKEAQAIGRLADKGDGSLREEGQSIRWNEFYIFEVE